MEAAGIIYTVEVVESYRSRIKTSPKPHLNKKAPATIKNTNKNKLGFKCQSFVGKTGLITRYFNPPFPQ